MKYGVVLLFSVSSFLVEALAANPHYHVPARWWPNRMQCFVIPMRKLR